MKQLFVRRTCRTTNLSSPSRFYSTIKLPSDWVVDEEASSHKCSLSKITKAPVHVFKHKDTSAQFVHIPTVDESFGFYNSVSFDHSLYPMKNGLLPSITQYMLSESLNDRLKRTEFGSALFDTKLAHLQSNYSVLTSNKTKAFRQFQTVSREIFLNGDEALCQTAFDNRIVSEKNQNSIGTFFVTAATKAVFGDVDISGYVYKYLYENTPFELIDQPFDLNDLKKTTQYEVTDFYHTNYTPNNCMFVSYGANDLETIAGQHLPFLSEEILQKSFSGSNSRESMLVKRWDSPRIVEITIPASQSDGQMDTSDTVVVAYLFDSSMSAYDRFVMNAISTLIFYYSPDGPLVKQTLSQGLGNSLQPDCCGFQSSLLNPSLFIGISGVDPKRSDLVEFALQNMFQDLASGKDTNNRYSLILNALLDRMNIVDATGENIIETISKLDLQHSKIDQLNYTGYCKQLRAEIAQKGCNQVIAHYLQRYVIGNNNRLTLIAHRDENMLVQAQEQLKSVLQQELPLDESVRSEHLESNSIKGLDIPPATASLLHTLGHSDQFFYNRQNSNGEILTVTASLTIEQIEPKLLQFLPVLSALIPMFGARDLPRSEWMSRLVSKYTSGMKTAYNVRHSDHGNSLVLSISSSSHYTNVYKLMDALSAFLLESEIAKPKPSEQLLGLIPNIIEQLSSQMGHRVEQSFSDVVRLETTSSNSRMAELLNSILGLSSVRFYENLLQEFNKPDSNKLQQQIMILGAIQTLYHNLVKSGRVEVVVTGRQGHEVLAEDAAGTYFDLNKPISLHEQFSPKQSQKFICIDKSDMNLSGALCRTVAPITLPEQLAHSYIICELLKLHYARDAELSKINATIRQSIDGIISICIVNNKNTFELLKQFDELLIDNNHSLKAIWEQLEDDMYEEGSDLSSHLQSRVLLNERLAEIPQVNPHERIRKDLDPISQTEEAETLSLFRKSVLQTRSWGQLEHLTRLIEKDTKSSITLIGKESDIPSEIRMDGGRTWLVTGATNFKLATQDLNSTTTEQPQLQQQQQQPAEESTSNFQ